ncbi:MAG: DISARM system phospholipase D-like protein DrmC [Myxococcales bacterium]|nr:DISARM system phospholipase D-like protein DrmC [Myxococcales bacterium]
MLRAVSAQELTTLLEHLESGRLTAPLRALALQSLGLYELAKHAPLFAGLDATATKTLASAVLAERAHRPQVPELVWTGPEGLAATSRRTEVVFRDLLGSAERDVWMAGYSIDHGGDLFAPLHRAMLDRGVKSRFLLNLELRAHERPEKTEQATAALLANRFFTKQWPFEGPKPTLFYDPRTLKKGVYASMHAKVVVVDEQRVLIGSANFTQRGQRRNIEAGVLLHDEAFAKQLVTQLQSLIDGGYVKRYGGGA